MKHPSLEFAFELRVEVSPLPEIGMTGKGSRRAIAIKGGSFEGPHIRGMIIPGGYDWQLLRDDGITEIDARYILQTEDGAMITIVNSGLRHGPDHVMQQLTEGQEVDPSEYYFRSVPCFETSEPKYNWLNKYIFFANGIRKSTLVIIQVWKML